MNRILIPCWRPPSEYGRGTHSVGRDATRRGGWWDAVVTRGRGAGAGGACRVALQGGEYRDGWTDGRTNGRMDGRTDGRTDASASAALARDEQATDGDAGVCERVLCGLEKDGVAGFAQVRQSGPRWTQSGGLERGRSSKRDAWPAVTPGLLPPFCETCSSLLARCRAALAACTGERPGEPTGSLRLGR